MDAYQGVEDKFADKFLEEDGSLKTGVMAEKATAAYHKVEDTVVGGYKKVENAFVDAFLEKVDEPESKDSEKKSNAKQRTAGTAQMYLRSLLFLRLSKHNANKLFHRLHEATEQFVTQHSLKSAPNCYIFTRNHLS